MNTIVISVGHTDSSPGAQALGRREFDLNLEVATALYEELGSRGYNVVLLDPKWTLKETIKWCQEVHSEDLCLEIHHNAFNGKASGAEVFHKRGDLLGFRLGKHLLESTCKALGLKNRGLKTGTQSARGSLGWLQLEHPLLWEVCFMDNQNDLEKTQSLVWSKAFVDALESLDFVLKSVLRTKDAKD